MRVFNLLIYTLSIAPLIQASNPPYEDEEYDETEVDENLNFEKTNYIGGTVRKIDYYACSFNSIGCTIGINLKSACVRCEACLAIADQINQTLILFHKKIHPAATLNETQIESLFSIICEYSFTKYGLIDVEGRRSIYSRIPEATPISTTVDDQWEEYLKNRCYEFTREIGYLSLYEIWKLWWNATNNNNNECYETGAMIKFEDVLCNDFSTYFHDCKNLNSTERRTLRSYYGNDKLKRKMTELF